MGWSTCLRFMFGEVELGTVKRGDGCGCEGGEVDGWR